MLARPMALSMPAEVSTVRGGALPLRGSSVMDLVNRPPIRAKSSRSVYSVPYPQVPEASSTGLRSRTRPICTDRSGSGGFAADPAARLSM
jgi:hypothetical protein